MVRRHLISLLMLTLCAGLWLGSGRAAHAAKEVFVRSKPHVNVGTIGGQAATIWFHAQAAIFEDQSAVGVLQVDVLDGERFFYRVLRGRLASYGRSGVIVHLLLERLGASGVPTGEMDLAVVRSHPTIGDCLIYDFVGPTVHVEAPGGIFFRGPG